MILSAWLRAVFVIPCAIVGLCGTAARASQTEPDSPPMSTESHVLPSSNQIKVAAKGKTQRSTAVSPARDLQTDRTPAQQQYGLPRNPIVGAAPDVDLAKPLSLERAIRIGLARQNSIAISQTDVDSADARLVQARSSHRLPDSTQKIDRRIAVFCRHTTAGDNGPRRG